MKVFCVNRVFDLTSQIEEYEASRVTNEMVWFGKTRVRRVTSTRICFPTWEEAYRYLDKRVRLNLQGAQLRIQELRSCQRKLRGLRGLRQWHTVKQKGKSK